MITIFSKVTDTENPYFDEIDNVLNSFKDGSNKKIKADELDKYLQEGYARGRVVN